MANTATKLFTIATLCASMSATAFAHPHDDDPAVKSEKTWPFFGSDENTETKSDTESRIEQKFKDHAERIKKRMEAAQKRADRAMKRNDEAFVQLKEDGLIQNPERIRDAAKALEEMLAESGFISSMADIVVDLAEDIEVDKRENGLTLKFDGETLGRFEMNRDAKVDERARIEAFGKNMNVEKQIIEKDGKKKMRIVIEMDADDDVEIEVKP